MSPRWPDAETRALQARLLEFIDTAPAGFVRPADNVASAWDLDAAAAAVLQQRYESLAMHLFAYQVERIPLYRRWCELQRRTPANVRFAQEIPALPVEALRERRVHAFPADCTMYRFETSGTTSSRTGALLLDDLSLYAASSSRTFRHHVLPDRDAIRMLSLIPSPQTAPHSSLSWMVGHVMRRYGTRHSDWFAQGSTLEIERLQDVVACCAADQEPLLLLGTAFGWAAFFDRSRERSWSVELPVASRLFETGGYKGRSRRLPRRELVASIGRHLGIPATHVVGEYGMTELVSQYYSLDLRRALLGTPLGADGAAAGRPVWSYPAWLRPGILVGNETAAPLPEKAQGLGLLQHHDIALQQSVAHLLTADLGRPGGAGFTLHGRAPAADLRGCGLVHAGEETAGERA